MNHTKSFDTLGDYLRYLRNTHQLTQSYVASQLYISRQTLSHYETNRIKPSPESLYRLAHVYCISMENFAAFHVDYDTDNSNSDYFRNTFWLEPNDQKAYLEFINIPANQKICKYLSPYEKHLIYYFRNLKRSDQEDLLCFLNFKKARMYSNSVRTLE